MSTLRERYEKAWQRKLDEIRRRDRSAPLIPYEAHDYALAEVARQAQTEALEEAAAWAKETSARLGVGSYAHGPSGRERDLSDKYEHASWWLEARAAAYRVGEGQHG